MGKQPDWQHMCSQHGLLNILNLLLRITPQGEKKKKKMYFKILLFTDNSPGHLRTLMEIH